jgi:serine/threonine-protein kinase HipA
LHEKKLKLAMALQGKNKHYKLTEIRPHHFDTTAHACGFGSDMRELMATTAAAIPTAIEQVASELPPDFPPQLFDTVTGGLLRMSKALRAKI